MVPGILGKKLGMTQIFTEEGLRIVVSVLEVGPCQVQHVKTVEKDGYNAVQIGFGGVKGKALSKPQRVYNERSGLEHMKFSREIRCSGAPEAEVGDLVTTADLQVGDYLDVTGVSKGKGFQGGMKRCGWSGGKETHGSKTHRVPGSIGASATPAKVFKGHGMPGQMGNERVTVQNIEIVDVDHENGTIAVKGSVPGANGSYLVLRLAKKMPVKPRPEKPLEQKESPPEEEAPSEEHLDEGQALPEGPDEAGEEQHGEGDVEESTEEKVEGDEEASGGPDETDAPKDEKKPDSDPAADAKNTQNEDVDTPGDAGEDTEEGPGDGATEEDKGK